MGHVYELNFVKLGNKLAFKGVWKILPTLWILPRYHVLIRTFFKPTPISWLMFWSRKPSGRDPKSEFLYIVGNLQSNWIKKKSWNYFFLLYNYGEIKWFELMVVLHAFIYKALTIALRRSTPRIWTATSKSI